MMNFADERYGNRLKPQTLFARAMNNSQLLQKQQLQQQQQAQAQRQNAAMAMFADVPAVKSGSESVASSQESEMSRD